MSFNKSMPFSLSYYCFEIKRCFFENDIFPFQPFTIESTSHLPTSIKFLVTTLQSNHITIPIDRKQ